MQPNLSIPVSTTTQTFDQFLQQSLATTYVQPSFVINHHPSLMATSGHSGQIPIQYVLLPCVQVQQCVQLPLLQPQMSLSTVPELRPSHSLPLPVTAALPTLRPTHSQPPLPRLQEQSSSSSSYHNNASYIDIINNMQNIALLNELNANDGLIEAPQIQQLMQTLSQEDIPELINNLSNISNTSILSNASNASSATTSTTATTSTICKTAATSTNKKFECEICHKLLSRKSNLKQHLKIHSNKYDFHCKFCPKGFKQKHSLIDHERTHTGEKPFKCDFCPKAFKVKHNLTTHRRLHTGEKPYECGLCLKRFTSKTSLNSHTKKKHPK